MSKTIIRVLLNNLQVSNNKLIWSSRQGMVFLLLAYLAVGAFFYTNSLDNGFHLDDQYYIVKNMNIRSIRDLPAIFTNKIASNLDPRYRFHYRPLVTMTYLLNYITGGLNPVGFHLVNLALHILSAFLVAIVLCQLTGWFWVSFTGGLLFLVHPLNSEAVNYITARSSLMYSLFYLVAFYAYIKYRPLPFNTEGHTDYRFLQDESKGRSYQYLGLSFLAYIFSMLSKEMAITLPVTLFLYEWMLRRPQGWKSRVWASLIPIGFAAAILIPYLAARAIIYGKAFPTHFVRDMTTQLATQTKVLIQTLWLFLFPVNLTIDHKVEVFRSLTDWPVIGCSIFLVGIWGLIIWWARSSQWDRRLAAFLLSWFFVTLLPVIVYPLNAILQENRIYLSEVGLVGVSALWMIRRGGEIGNRWQAWGRLLLPVIIGLVVLVCGGMTFQRNTIWKDDITLWTDAVSKNPLSPASLDNLAVAYGRAGQWDLAIKQYQRSLAINQNNPIATFNMGFAAKEQGRLNDAEMWYKRALRLDPQFFQVYYNLGHLYKQEGRWEEALWAFSQVVKLAPDNLFGRRALADTLVEAGRYDDAIKEYEILMNMGISDQTIKAEVRDRMAQIRGRDHAVK